MPLPVPTAAPTSPPGGDATPPMEAPMSTPEMAAGDKAAATATVHIAMKVLESALPKFGSHTPEGQAVLNTLRTLSKAFGENASKSKELMPAELQQMLANMPPPGAGAPPPPGMPPIPPGAAGMPPPPGA